MSILEQFRIKSRRAVVTGASRGIGRAIALGLAECGADVLIHAATRRAQAESVADEARALGVRAGVSVADLGDAEAPQQIFDTAVEKLGGVDILVLNASVQFEREPLTYDRAEFDKAIIVNLRASVELMQLVAPGMKERQWGRILTIGSVQQFRPSSHMGVYPATKNAQLTMTRIYARQLGKFGITVNNLAPGLIDTDRNAKSLGQPGRREKWQTTLPVGRIGTPEDCVGAAVLLCSNAGSYFTGADILVDGGLAL